MSSRNPYELNDQPINPSDRKLGEERIITALDTDNPTNETVGIDVSEWKHILRNVHPVSPDLSSPETGWVVTVRPWRYYKYANSGTDTPNGQWFADSDLDVSMDGDTTATNPMSVVYPTFAAEKMYFQIVASIGTPGQSWSAAIGLYGLVNRREHYSSVSSVSNSSVGGSEPEILATHDSAVITQGPQIMGSARTSQEAAVVNGDAARFVLNANGELVLASHTWATQSDRNEEIDPLNQQAVEDLIIDDTTIAADPGTSYAPSADGILMFGYKDISFQLYIKGGIKTGPTNTTITVTFQGTDDLVVSAATRWVDITQAGYDLGSNSNGNASFTATGATVADHIIDFDEFNCKRIRVVYDFDDDPDSTNGAIVVKSRRKSL